MNPGQSRAPAHARGSERAVRKKQRRGNHPDGELRECGGGHAQNFPGEKLEGAHRGNQDFHGPRGFFLQHRAHGDDAVHKQRGVKQDNQGDGDPDALPFLHRLAGLADFQELEVRALENGLDVVQVHAAIAEAPRNHGLVHSARKRADKAEVIGIAHVQLERFLGIARNPEICVEFPGIDARAQVGLHGVRRSGLNDSVNDVEFRLPVFELGIQAVRDRLR